MMNGENLPQRGYKKALQYEEKQIGGKLGRIDDIYARAK